jgi:hypothetical protein
MGFRVDSPGTLPMGITEAKKQVAYPHAHALGHRVPFPEPLRIDALVSRWVLASSKALSKSIPRAKSRLICFSKGWRQSDQSLWPKA